MSTFYIPFFFLQESINHQNVPKTFWIIYNSAVNSIQLQPQQANQHSNVSLDASHYSSCVVHCQVPFAPQTTSVRYYHKHTHLFKMDKLNYRFWWWQ